MIICHWQRETIACFKIWMYVLVRKQICLPEVAQEFYRNAQSRHIHGIRLEQLLDNHSQVLWFGGGKHIFRWEILFFLLYVQKTNFSGHNKNFGSTAPNSPPWLRAWSELCRKTHTFANPKLIDNKSLVRVQNSKNYMQTFEEKCFWNMYTIQRFSRFASSLGKFSRNFLGFNGLV